MEEDFSFLQPLDLITKDVHELRQMINDRRKKLQKERSKEFEKEHEGERGQVREKERHEREKEVEKDREKDRLENDKEREQQHGDQTDREMVTDQEDKVTTVKHEENGTLGGNQLFNGIDYIILYKLCSLLHVWHVMWGSHIIFINNLP